MQSDTSATDCIAKRQNMKTFHYCVPRGCVFTHSKGLLSGNIYLAALKMRLIKIFFISAGAILQLLVFSVIVALSAFV